MMKTKEYIIILKVEKFLNNICIRIPFNYHVDYIDHIVNFIKNEIGVNLIK